MVKTIQMKLDVNKTTANNELIRIRQGDKNSTKLEVEVLYDGQPYSLTGLSATFNATKPDGKVVVENATINENKIIYILNSQVGASSGTISKAYFSIKNTSGVEIDSTSNFRIDVLTGTDVSAGSSDYVDILESTRLKAQNLLTQIDDSIAMVDGVVAQINTLGQQASNTLKEKLEGLSTQATTGVNDIKAQLQELISSKIANIQSQADAKLASIQKDWNTLKPKLQAEINALSTKVSGIDDKSNTIKTRLDALVVQLDSIDIVSVKAVADKATADVAELRERKTYLHTAYSWSADGTDRFMTVYPGENLVLGTSNELKTWKASGWGNLPASMVIGTYGAGRYYASAYIENTTPTGLHIVIRINGINYNTNGNTIQAGQSGITSCTFDILEGQSLASMWFGFTSSQTESCTYKYKEMMIKRMPSPWTPSPLDDPEGAYPKFVGTYTDYTADDSTDPAKYEWIPIPRPNEKNVLTVEGEMPDKFGNVVIPQIAQNTLDIKNLTTRNNSQDVTISKLTKSVNGVKPDASGNISLPQPDLTPYVTNSALALKLASYYDKTTADGRYLPKTTSFATPAQVTTAETNAKSYADTKKSEAQSYTDTKLSGVLKSWTGTQAQYNAISTKDSNTLYIIKEEVV